jgi:hypothetical protein
MPYLSHVPREPDELVGMALRATSRDDGAGAYYKRGAGGSNPPALTNQERFPAREAPWWEPATRPLGWRSLTRSGKMKRRLLRDVAENRPAGDVTTLADSSVI